MNKLTAILVTSMLTGCTVANNEPANNRPTAESRPVTTPTAALPTPTEHLLPPNPGALDKIVPEIKKIVAAQQRLDPVKISADVGLSDPSIGADELDIIEIVMSIEEKFDVALRDEDLGGGDLAKVRQTTINQLAALVAHEMRRVRGGSPPKPPR